LTEAAVKVYQCKAGIICAGMPSATGWGNVGLKTRVHMSQGSTITPSDIKTSAMQEQLRVLQEKLKKLLEKK
ncbi:MAG: hypothetical protein AAB975_00135, partial [Patescibacteria group bacterium]